MKYFLNFNFKIYYKLDRLGIKLNFLIKRLGDFFSKKDLKIIF